ncbi:MAG: ABC transporter ATP-binding protein [Rhodospirillales bacterium]|nr:ABC transporter ATP-binding protein [Rhodospirillales bacterium]
MTRVQNPPAGTTGLDHSTKALMRRLLLDHVRPHWPRLALAVACMVVGAMATAALAKLMEPIIDGVFVNRDRDMLVWVAGAVLLVFFLKGMATYGQAMLMSYVGQRIVSDLQVDLYGRLIRSDMATFNDTPSGTLVSRLVNDVGMLRGAVSMTLTSIGKDALTLILLIAVMFRQDWQLAAVAFVIFPLAVLPIVNIGKRMRKVATRTQVQVGQLVTLFGQTFQGARHVKAYGMEGYETGRARDAVESMFGLVQRAARTRSIAHPIMETLGGVAIVSVIVYGGHQVIDGNRTAGAFFSFITALLLAYEPMKKLAALNSSLQEGLAAATRVFSVLDSAPRIVDGSDAIELDAHGASIRFANVHFGYRDDRAALDGVNLEVPAGKTVALVGPSGSGKSTILNLIPRFYDVDSGKITIGGHDVRAIKLQSLRQNIALVSQEVSLFDDTIGRNIKYGNPDASDEDVERAAKLAGVHEIIEALPEGYKTLVGEHGVKLSGGQRQRIMIARALLKNAPILLLDEATSSLDGESERQLRDALAALMHQRTTLIVAHRLTNVTSADIIYYLANGHVIESGTHHELMARGGAYARLYALQSADDPQPALRAVVLG